MQLPWFMLFAILLFFFFVFFLINEISKYSSLKYATKTHSVHANNRATFKVLYVQ